MEEVLKIFNLKLMHLWLWFSFGVLFALLAKRKNRNPFFWGIVGGYPYIAIISLGGIIYAKFLCPKCKHPLKNKQWKNRICPNCGDF